MLGAGVHLAQYVVLAGGVVVAPVICAPPVELDVLNHPTNLNPGLVGSCGKVPIVKPGCLDNVCDAGAPPTPLALNVNTTLATGVHLAQYVAFVAGVIELPVICAPPVALGVLNHPTNLNPGLVGSCGIAPIAEPGCLDNVCVAGVPPAPLALNVKVTFAIGAHLAK